MSNHYSKFLSVEETMPRDQLQQLQEVRLLATLKQAYATSPLFKSVWDKSGVNPADIKTIDDFTVKAPFFDKDTIREYRDDNNHPLGGLVDLDNPLLTSIASTSGTTGDPTPMPMRYNQLASVGYMRDYWHFGVRPGDFILMALFTFRGGPGNGAMVQNEHGVTSIFVNHSPAALPRFIDAIKTFKPTFCGLISSPLILAMEKYFEQTKENPAELFSSIKGFVYGGEALSPRLNDLTDKWGMTLYHTTAAGDMISATQCTEQDGFHVYEDLMMVECLDVDTDEPMADGEVGELVVTGLYDPLLTMVRYRTDDLVKLDRSPCACGRTHVKLTIEGRKGDQILVQGKPVLPKDLRFLIEANSETSAGLFQIIKTAREMDVLAVRVGYNPDQLTGTQDELIAKLENMLNAELDLPMRVELTPDAELLKLGPPHKIPRVTKA